MDNTKKELLTIKKRIENLQEELDYGISYLQELKEEEQVSKVAISLKTMSLELDIPTEIYFVNDLNYILEAQISKLEEKLKKF